MKFKTINHIRRKLGMDKDLNKTILDSEKVFKKRVQNINADVDLSDFLKLLQIAEYGHLGKARAILFAFKIGYLNGKESAGESEVVEDVQ